MYVDGGDKSRNMRKVLQYADTKAEKLTCTFTG